MSTKTLKRHINEIYSEKGLDTEALTIFLEKFKVLGAMGINANSMFYILNLHTLTYEYINNACKSFVGYVPSDFYSLGMTILPKIIIPEDFTLLSEQLFPKMNEITKDLSVANKKNIVFELYYKVVHKDTKKVTQMVEFSSYSEFTADGIPVLSTGICYESPLMIKGVKGIVRMNDKDEQKELFHEQLTTKQDVLTPTEKEIVNLLIQGMTRKEIAKTKSISVHTVSTHIKKVYKKLGVNKASELATRVL